MSKSEQSIEAPNVIRGNRSTVRKYYFENKEQPGQPHSFFAGDAPIKGGAKSEKDMKVYNLQHGKVCELPEHIAEHLKSKGLDKPIMEENERGELRPTGEYYKKKNFELHEA